MYKKSQNRRGTIRLYFAKVFNARQKYRRNRFAHGHAIQQLSKERNVCCVMRKVFIVLKANPRK
ncbi:MAG: hypothetical protein A3D92_20075 [Bacteroidetes bacterium RIFCSPHIGHO2_02_FULL_44_7]|nr:MAG: hypothetical protein A3D92_20075 [Bacteroidetes bacterium RIFCSPHIGHO2_02_FULL_44_7]